MKVVNMADGSDEEDYERDELHKWYEVPGFTDSEEQIDLSKQDW